MIKKSLLQKFDNLAWAFALINGRVGEVYFEKGKGISSIHSHCYHNENDKWTKIEKKMIERDLIKNRFTYRKGKYSLAKSIA